MTTATPYSKLLNALTKASNEGKVLDVSNLTAEGTGARGKARPKTTRTTQRWVADFPVMSDNYHGYALAMALLGESGTDYSGYSAAYLQTYGQGKVKAPAVKKPKVARVVTPVDAATLRQKLTLALENARQKGLVLDVSELQADGTGTRARKVPVSGAGTKRQVENFPVISNNLHAYQAAMAAFGPEYTQLAQEFHRLHGAARIVKAAAGSKGAKGKAPRKVKDPSTVQPIAVEALQAKVVKALNDAQTAGKVLDVSKLLADGTGMRAIPRPTPGKGTKRSLEGLDIVSNNYEAFARAINSFGPEYSPYIQAFLDNFGAAPIVRAAAAPSTVNPRSPKKYGDVPAAFPMSPGVRVIRFENPPQPGAKRVKSPSITVSGGSGVQIPTRAASPSRLVPTRSPTRFSPVQASPSRVSPSRLSPVRAQASPTRLSPVQVSPSRLSPVQPRASPTRLSPIQARSSPRF